MYLNKNEVKAIAKMLDYYDETVYPSTLNEVIGVVRFKIFEDRFDKEDDEEKKVQEQMKESEVSVDK